jgi:glycolate oxidase
MGIGSYKYKSAKDNILNAHVVIDNGNIITTGFDGMGSYGMSYNLNQFFAGAEGTLGVIADVTFRIYPLGEYRFLGYEYDKLSAADPALQKIVANPSVIPLHMAWSDYLHFQNQHRAGIHAPDVSNLFLVTFQGDKAHNDMCEAFVDAASEEFGGRKISSEIAGHEWEERCYEFRARKVGVGEIPAEVIVPTHNWGEYVDICYDGFEVMKMEPGGIIGVMVDRSTTLFMPYYFKDDEMITGMLPFGFNFYMGDRAAEFGGRSTGLGVFFAWQLDVIHNAPTVKKMSELKTVLDHHDVVNPGHVVCGMTRFGINLGKPVMSIGSTVLQTMKKMLPKDTTFSDNLKRFRYNDMEHLKTLDRHHKLGDGTQ